jgi:2-dehydro-3-deoxyphosphogluconate aldolase / (4S)-4-hydroxy-2-oxoglutarate aldolase
LLYGATHGNRDGEKMLTAKKEEVVELIRSVGLVPVLRVPSADQAFLAVEGIVQAELPIVEITLTIPGALQIISDLSKRYGERLLIGAGTVLNIENCRAAIAAGAKFVVSPGLSLEVIRVCRELGVAVFPGALTPTEVLAAWDAGADVVKIFPCGLLGGAKYIRALKGPFPHVPLLPTNGITLENLAEFLSAGAVAVGVGEKIFDPTALRQGDVGPVRSSARQFMEAARSALDPAVPSLRNV